MSLVWHETPSQEQGALASNDNMVERAGHGLGVDNMVGGLVGEAEGDAQLGGHLRCSLSARQDH